MSANILLDVASANDRGRRLVVAIYNGGEHRDTLCTNSAWSRKHFLAQLAAKIGTTTDALKHLDEEMVAKADAADAAIDAAGDGQREEDGRKSAATQLVELAADDELFHDAERTAYASLVVDGCRQTWRVRSSQYRDTLRRRFFAETQRVPSSQGLQDAVGMLEAKAAFEGPQEAVALRIAEHKGAIYLDLGNERWEAVEITPDGWGIVRNPPVRFRARSACRRCYGQCRTATSKSCGAS